MKEQLKHYIQEYMGEYKYLVSDLYEHPEIGNQEFHSMCVLCKILRKGGFEVTGEYMVPTDFLGVWNSGKPEPVIAYTYEYDALPEVGHDCGHDLIAGMLLAAGCALKSILSNIGEEVRTIGTSAEEDFGGRASMAAARVFGDASAALMPRPDAENSLGGRTLAIYPLRFEFFGRNAHACTPQGGKNALDTTVMNYMLINLLRQFAEPNTFIHGVIAHEGEVANVVPAYTNLEYYFRGKTVEYVKELCEKAEACIGGAYTMSGCTSCITAYKCPYDDCIISYTPANMLKDEYEDFGYPWGRMDEVTQENSDVGSVSYCCPTLQGYIKIVDSYIDRHSHEMTAATISQQGNRALFDEALTLADTGRRLIMEPGTMKRAWKELKANRE